MKTFKSNSLTYTLVVCLLAIVLIFSILSCGGGTESETLRYGASESEEQIIDNPQDNNQIEEQSRVKGNLHDEEGNLLPNYDVTFFTCHPDNIRTQRTPSNELIPSVLCTFPNNQFNYITKSDGSFALIVSHDEPYLGVDGFTDGDNNEVVDVRNPLERHPDGRAKIDFTKGTFDPYY